MNYHAKHKENGDIDQLWDGQRPTSSERSGIQDDFLFSTTDPIQGPNYQDKDGPEILIIRCKRAIYELHFRPYAIANGLLISDIKKCAAEKLNTEPRRLLLIYKHKCLGSDSRMAKEYDLKHKCEISCVIPEKGKQKLKERNTPRKDGSDLQYTNRVEQQTASCHFPPPKQPAQSQSGPMTDFHSIAAQPFQEDVFVWSSVTRELTPTQASVDTQSDRNLVYVGFLDNDLRLEYKRYNDGEAVSLKTLAGSVWPLGWVMLKIFPVRNNPQSGIKERQRPQYVIFDVYQTEVFGDMLLGNEYAQGNNICNFLVKGSRKTTERRSMVHFSMLLLIFLLAETEALRRRRDEELRRFEAEIEQQTQNGILMLRDL
jgi:hypothetical protein